MSAFLPATSKPADLVDLSMRQVCAHRCTRFNLQLPCAERGKKETVGCCRGGGRPRGRRRRAPTIAHHANREPRSCAPLRYRPAVERRVVRRERGELRRADRGTPGQGHACAADWSPRAADGRDANRRRRASLSDASVTCCRMPTRAWAAARELADHKHEWAFFLSERSSLCQIVAP